MKILAYIGFFIFSVSWSIVTTALLPAESVDGRKKTIPNTMNDNGGCS